MHIHYNTNQTTLPLELSSILPANHIVFTIEEVVNELEDGHFRAFYQTFGRPSYHPKMLLSALLFAYSQGGFSGRKMEKLVTLDCLFIDGTKIEANANKYSFVWKNAVDKFSPPNSKKTSATPSKKPSFLMTKNPFRQTNWLTLPPFLKKSWQN